MRSLQRTAASLLALGALLVSTAAAPPQGKAKDGCPYCHDDPELLAKAGLVSHGPIDIGPEGGSARLAERLAASDWLFLESTHLRWASSLAAETIKGKDRERLEAELAELRALFPDVPEKVKKLDPWLRLHLMAARGEKFYARFQRLLGVTDADFPEQRTNDGPYMGNGRFLGEKDKFEVLLHVNGGTHRMFTTDHMGVAVTDSLRWHFQGLHKLLVSIPTDQPDIRYDRYLYPHTVHNLSHVFLCAYKHFSYDPPIWLDEGLAHAMEHEVDPTFHTLDGEEGSMPDNRGPGDWDAELKKLAGKKRLTPFAELLRVHAFAELDQDAHVTSYGLVRFLIDEHPEALAKFIGELKGQLDAEGYPDGSNLREVQREQLQALWGWSPAQLDEAFAAWIAARE